MKKVLSLSLFFAIITFSASAQNGMKEGLRKHKIEQRLQNRNGHVNHPGNAKLRKEILQHRMMKQRAMSNRGEGKKIRNRQMLQHRKMMMRRYYMHRRVI